MGGQSPHVLLPARPRFYIAVRYWFGITDQFPHERFSHRSPTETVEAIQNALVQEQWGHWGEYKNRLANAEQDTQQWAADLRLRLGYPGSDLRRTAAPTVANGPPPKHASVFCRKHHDLVGKTNFAAWVAGWFVDPEMSLTQQALCSRQIWFAEFEEEAAAKVAFRALQDFTPRPVAVQLPANATAKFTLLAAEELTREQQLEAHTEVRRLFAMRSLDKWEKLAVGQYWSSLLPTGADMQQLAEMDNVTPTPPPTIQAEPAPAAVPIDEPVRLSVEKDGWIAISGLGESGHVNGKLKGFKIIRRLMEASPSSLSWEHLHTGGNSSSASRDFRGDQEAKQKAAESLLAINEEREIANQMGDFQRIQELDNEVERIGAQLNKDMGIGYKSRPLNCPNERARPSVIGALDRAYKALREHHPPLARIAEHLEGAITPNGGAVSYSPHPTGSE